MYDLIRMVQKLINLYKFEVTKNLVSSAQNLLPVPSHRFPMEANKSQAIFRWIVSSWEKQFYKKSFLLLWYIRNIPTKIFRTKKKWTRQPFWPEIYILYMWPKHQSQQFRPYIGKSTHGCGLPWVVFGGVDAHERAAETAWRWAAERRRPL